MELAHPTRLLLLYTWKVRAHGIKYLFPRVKKRTPGKYCNNNNNIRVLVTHNRHNSKERDACLQFFFYKSKPEHIPHGQT